MKDDFKDIEEKLPGYLSGELDDRDRALVDEWRAGSSENETAYHAYLKAWEALPAYELMEQFNSFEALKKVNRRLSLPEKFNRQIMLQRIAVVLIIPLLVYSGYLTLRNSSIINPAKEQAVMQTVTSRQGMVTDFELADGTKVWLNSGSSLQSPMLFTGDLRTVKLTGEAYFEVTRDEKKPFRVKAGDLNIEVLGTSFNVVSYAEDRQSEVVLVEGKVNLFTEKDQVKKVFGILYPGQRAIYKEDSQMIAAEKVEVDKYISWREGNLIFRNDNMEDVVRRLSRWFNVEIIIKDPEIKNYGYKASFRNETLTQVLNLLKLSAPIDYQITGNTLMKNGEYTKQKVYLMKRK
jgi:transmembrane sensor